MTTKDKLAFALGFAVVAIPMAAMALRIYSLEEELTVQMKDNLLLLDNTIIMLNAMDDYSLNCLNPEIINDLEFRYMAVRARIDFKENRYGNDHND